MSPCEWRCTEITASIRKHVSKTAYFEKSLDKVGKLIRIIKLKTEDDVKYPNTMTKFKAD